MEAPDPGAPPVAAPAAAAPADDPDDALVQFVVVRRDLLKDMSWPVGSVIAQACHACLAVAWESRDDPNVSAYLSDIDSMHKVVKECKGARAAHRLLPARASSSRPRILAAG